ncbi:MAG TPA: J domain-containing protein [Candidatus Obscuribacterales bacterium]
MTQNRANQKTRERGIPKQNSYYALLGLHPSASALEIRRTYRELSKRYHPDTTELPSKIAIAKFQQLNEAYATLSNPERRTAYDHKIGYSRISVIQAPPNLNRPVSQPEYKHSSSAYLDPTDRPLSAGEIFALFILGITFVVCLLLAIVIGLTRGEAALQVSTPPALPPQAQIISPWLEKPASPPSPSSPDLIPNLKSKI